MNEGFYGSNKPSLLKVYLKGVKVLDHPFINSKIDVFIKVLPLDVLL